MDKKLKAIVSALAVYFFVILLFLPDITHLASIGIDPLVHGFIVGMIALVFGKLTYENIIK